MSDTEIIKALNEGGKGTKVEFDDRHWQNTGGDVWHRFNPTTGKIKIQFPTKCTKELIDSALDWINKTEFNHGIKDNFHHGDQYERSRLFGWPSK